MSSNQQGHSQQAPAAGKRGTLTIVGSGISSVGQLTLQTVGLIENADKVFYVVSDPVTEAYIQSKNKNSVDLSMYYGNHKQRRETYVQQAEVMLKEVRAGHDVVGVFYGHPGVCVLPSFRAMAIAREEGHAAKMYPGVSALDCLFADLEVDPARLGCAIYEARDLLVRERPLLLSSHVILLQVWVVGITDYSYGGYKNNKNFTFLVDHLEKAYGSHHPVLHYTAALLPQANPIIEKYAIGDLRKSEVQNRFSSGSTLYLPPKTVTPFNRAVGAALGDIKSNPPLPRANKSTPLPYPPINWLGAETPEDTLSYNERDKLAVAALDGHAVPQGYRPLSASEPMKKIMIKLATDSKVFEEYQKNPAVVISSTPGLTSLEKKALVSRNDNLIRSAMKAIATDPANQFLQALLRDPNLAKQYSTVLQQNTGSTETAAITAWIVQQGYNTTVEAVRAAFVTMESQSLDAYASSYNTFVNGVAGPQITIAAGTVVVDGTNIKLFTYSNSVLSWNAADGNPSSAQLTFVVLTSDDGQPLPSNAYIGPQFTGYYWTASVNAKPEAPNAIGRNGAFPPGGGDLPPSPSSAGAPLTTWADTYQAYALSGTKWVPESTLKIDDGGVSYDNQAITSYSYSNDTISWKASDGNPFSATIHLFVNKPTKSNPTPGNQFYGKKYGPNDPEPTASNWLGLIGAGTNQNTLSGAASQLSSATQWKQLGVQLGIGVAVMLLGDAVLNAIKLSFKGLSKAYQDAVNKAKEEGKVADKSEEDPAVEEPSVPAGQDPPIPDAPSAPVDPVPVDPVPVDPVPVDPVPVDPVPVDPVPVDPVPVDPVPFDPVSTLCTIL